jgi:glycosyltransferase involved in cell wall biosynthesis
MVAPLNIARGTQNKILEAMALGVPVVTSSVAAAGVDAVPQEHFLVTDSYEGNAAAVLRILNSRDERQRLARAGRSRMLSHHDWGRSMQRLDQVIERCLGEFGRRPDVRRASAGSAIDVMPLVQPISPDVRDNKVL